MYLHYYGKRPETLNDYFVMNDSIHSCNTRSDSKIHIDLKRTNYGKFSLQYRGAIMWNSLPNDTKELKSSNAFKKVLHHVQSAKKILFDSDTLYATFIFIFNYVKKSLGILKKSS